VKAKRESEHEANNDGCRNPNRGRGKGSPLRAATSLYVRDLRADAPRGSFNYHERFNQWLSGFSLEEQIVRQISQNKASIKDARAQGKDETANCLETAEAALADAKEALK